MGEPLRKENVGDATTKGAASERPLVLGSRVLLVGCVSFMLIAVSYFVPQNFGHYFDFLRPSSARECRRASGWKRRTDAPRATVGLIERRRKPRRPSVVLDGQTPID
jgi:hypothetical protein